MDGTLDDQYLTWLYSQTGSVRLRNKARTHWSLLRQLYSKEFVWLVPNDDNRVEDGRDLRYEFLHETGHTRADRSWLSMGCSFLEMLVALSRRLAFEDDGDPKVWFWHLMDNLELRQYTDRDYDDVAAELVDEVLDRVIWRRYAENGKGGLFPLRHPKEDQRKIEIWYQLSGYMIENF